MTTTQQGQVPYGVLFVCLGNICRSPLAQGVFEHLAAEAGVAGRFIVDSCGTGHWHVGAPPHRDSRRVAAKHGISIDSQRARQLEASDLSVFHTIVAMDRENLRAIKALHRGEPCEIHCLREFDPQPDSPDVPDPYYGGPDGFEDVFNIIKRSCEVLLKKLANE